MHDNIVERLLKFSSLYWCRDHWLTWHNKDQRRAEFISQSPPVSGHRPSATVLFNSVAGELGRYAIGVIMTGMGDDGVEGLARIKENGGVTLAQDEETSVIYGMPKVAAEKGYADMVLGLYEIVPRLVNIIDFNGAKTGLPLKC